VLRSCNTIEGGVARAVVEVGRNFGQQVPPLLVAQDHKVRVESSRSGMVVQQLRAKGVKGLDGDAPRIFLAQQRRQPLAHLLRRLVGEGDRQHASPAPRQDRGSGARSAW
jgi:hypothetical protein